MKSKKSSQERIFSNIIKNSCWNNARQVPGRNKDIWRFDSYGNIVCRALKGCFGCLCHEYDHIVPYSKGGPSSVENCQILQTNINRLKGALIGEEEVYMSQGCDKKFSHLELDLIELALYGKIDRQ